MLTAVSLLMVGAVLIAVSRSAQIDQIAIRQQKTSTEAVLATSSYLRQARDALALYAQSKRLLAMSASTQQAELQAILNQNPSLFEEVALIDEQGTEQARLSRVYTYLPNEMSSRASSPAFQQALNGQVYVAQKVEISPQSGLPVLTMAVPHEVDFSKGVLMAEVSVKAMWDTLSQLEVGETGYAYIVDRTNGQIVAHSNLSRYLRLRGQTISAVPSALLVQIMGSASLAKPIRIDPQYIGLEGAPVIGAAAPFAETDWVMIAELPTSEALASVRNMVYLLAGLLLVGMIAAAGLGLAVPRRLVQPLQVLQEGAHEIEKGHLDHVLQVKTGDEMESLADAFNQMAAGLKSSQAEVRRWGDELEAKVEERTQELAVASQAMQRRAVQLETSAEVTRAIASVHDPERLLPQVAQLISERFGWYHVGIFLIDETGAGRYAVLKAASSEGGRRMLERGHRLKVGEVGIVGYVAGSGQSRIALDVGHDAVFFDNPDLPATRSEMALPLKTGELIIGALDVQSTEAAAYDQEDVALLSTLADQVAIAIENARLFEESRQALREVQSVHRQYLQQEWSRVVSRRGQLAYEYRDAVTMPLADRSFPEIDLAIDQGEVVTVTDRQDLAKYPRKAKQGGPALDRMGGSSGGKEARAALAAPIKLREQTIGVVDLQQMEQPRYWTDDEVALVKAVSDQVALALENVRLLEAEHAQRIAAEALREAAVTLSGTLAFDELIGRILDQVGRVVPSDASNLMLIEGDMARIVASRGYEQFNMQEEYSNMQMPAASLRTLQEMQATGQPLLVADTARHPTWMVRDKQEWLRSYLGAPIIIRGQLVGVLNVDSSMPNFFAQEQANQLAAFAAQAAIALQNAQLMGETSRRAEQLTTLNRIGLSLTSGLELERVLQSLYDQCGQVMPADTFYVALYDRATGQIDIPMLIDRGHQVQVAPLSIDPRRANPLEGAGITGYVIQAERPLYIPDTEAIPPDAPYRGIAWQEQDTRSYMGTPLTARGQVMGVLSIQSYQPNAYTADDLELLGTIATQASIAIDNAQAYQRLVETAEQLREVDRLKTQFLANMSHELRTPLNSIIGFSRVILKGIDGPLTELQTADLNSIHNSGQHLLKLINDVLDMSKIEAGRMDLSFDEVNLDEIFQSVLSTARALVKDKTIELKSTAPDDLPTVWADGQRVRQVLINLLSNAAKFTEQGEIVIHATVGAVSPTRPATVGSPEFMTISVSDTGIGIDKEAQKKLFTAFGQVDASTTRRAGGTGLGLAICRSFVEMQGGEIWVESEPDKGSTFYFTLPIYQAMRRKIEAEAAGTSDDPAATPTGGIGRPVILAVDDDMGVITLLKRYLERDGYQVVGVTQPRRAVEMARNLAPNLVAITLDVVMPQMDGWQVLRALKEDPLTRDAPVILCSIVEGLERGLSMGAAAYLNKPVTRDEVLAALRKVSHLGSADRAASRRPQEVPTTGSGPEGVESGRNG